MTKEYEKCMHAFCLKAMKMIHSLVRTDVCIAECVNSFENVASTVSHKSEYTPHISANV